MDHTNLLQTILHDRDNKVIFAYLFGSRAAGVNTYPPRDIDLAVYFQPKDGSFFDAKLDLYGALSRRLKTNDIHILVLNEARNLVLMGEVVRQGIVLIDRDPDLREEFEQNILHQALDFQSQRISLLGF
jgi:predicted nucleotidyltransferase